MAKSFRKITTWLLGVLTCVALALGFISTRSEVRASAETSVTFSSVVCDAMDNTYGLPIRLNTSVLAWDTYHNWVNADAWKSISDYTAINGKTVTEINAETSSTQKITLMMQPAGSFSFLRLYVPTTVMAKEDIRSVEILDGWSFNNGKDTFTAPGVEYSYYANQWIQQVEGVELATEVTNIITYANRTDGGTNENFVLFQLSNNDYNGLNTRAIADVSSLYGYIDINGSVLVARPNEPYFNVWGINNTLAFRAPGLNASQLSQVSYITIKAGAKFPAYTTQNGGEVTYYVTQKDATFIHSVPNDTWTKETASTQSYTVTFTVDGGTYSTQTVKEGSNATAPTTPTKAADSEYTYTFKQWTLNGSAYDFTTPVTGNITLVAEFTATPKGSDVDVTSEITLVHQAKQYAGTETYMLKTNSNYWTKAPKGGCLNEYDSQNAGGGQEQMKYIYLNGVSLYDINKNDNGSYGSSQPNIASGGIYAPILVTMGSDQGKYSYIQIHVPTGYPNAGQTADENHQSIEFKAGFSVTENGSTYIVTKDMKWMNVKGTWVNADSVATAGDISIGEGKIDGTQLELVAVSVKSSKWNFTRDPFDYNYYSDERFVAMRKNIFINGVSVFDINTTVDDGGYNYVTSPQNNTHTGNYNGTTYETFANPVYLYCKGDEIIVNIHSDYLKTLGGGAVTLTFGEGFVAYDGVILSEDVSAVITENYEVTVNGITQIVVKNMKVVRPATPTKPATPTVTYVFKYWYDVETDAEFDFNTPITKNYTIEAYFEETGMKLIQTEVTAIVHHLKTTRNDTWMIFQLSNNDYESTLNTAALTGGYDELLRIGFLENIILKGTIVLQNRTVSEASLMDVYNAYGAMEGPFFNIWAEIGTFALRVPVGTGVEEIVIQAGCNFPSYSYTSGKTTNEIRYGVTKTATYRFEEDVKAFNKQAAVKLDVKMAPGAAVRLTSDMETSGIRFETMVATKDVESLYAQVGAGKKYSDVVFGVMIVPTDYLMGGQFTHEWLANNGYEIIDIPYSITELYRFFPKEENGYSSFYGSIVKLKEENYNREFSGLGYIMLIDQEGNAEYIYAAYDQTNKRTAAFIANAAISDRNGVKADDYTHYISANNNYSKYSERQNAFLANYLVWEGVSAINAQSLPELANKGGSATITPTTQKLAGPYIELLYSTNVNVWGEFTYTDGSKTAKEDFYLQAGTTKHRQYLDIFRDNAVGVGMNANNLSMTSIKFTNAELANSNAPAGNVKVVALYSQNKTIDMDNQEIYLTVKQANGSEITVGAHLGLGGALTYLAKSGIYEGVTDSGYRSGNVKISTNTSDFVAERNTTLLGSKEKGYYGHATSSKAADGAVNLINNTDAGRQIQQSWYAAVGGEATGEGNGSNGYTRAFCKTESSAGKYWPYNPVQAGDVVSNPSQIVDYEINEKSGYIYIKARAMDWAKGQGSDKLANTIVGGSTTKSYVENYYRLNTDGTVIVNNAYVDWNGFTDMELCGWASTELPAVYPVHTLNYYVSNLNGDGTWKDTLEYNSNLGSWTTDSACRQITVPNEEVTNTKVEDWFAWANGGNGNAFAMGVYIPNVNRFTSGRAKTSTAMSVSANKDAKTDNVLQKKGLMSNMQEIKYTYQSAYVTNTSYTAPGIDFRMEAYKSIEYSYAICLDTVDNIRATFKAMKDNGTITNAGDGYQKVGLDAWARADKSWTW